MDEMLKYLEDVKFEKYLKRLNKKLKGKTVVIYGSGLMFQKANANYDLSKLNIIGISDRKYSDEQFGQEDLGYKIVPLDRIKEVSPDYVLLATQRFLSILDDFRNVRFKDTGIKVLPLVDKPFLTLLKEIFE